MKTPEYVATVTRIYANEIQRVLDKGTQSAISKDSKPQIIQPQINPKKELMQVFNRGGFSLGHLENTANRDLVFKEKPNNMGLFLGKVMKYNKNKGHITLKLNENIEIGDTISLEKENGKYTISELMINGKNSTSAASYTIVTIGRMKGKISLGDKVFKMSSKSLSKFAQDSYSKENIKIKLDCTLKVKQGYPITMSIFSNDVYGNYKGVHIEKSSDIIPIQAKSAPITKDRIISQISKTKNTPYEFKNISVDLDENTYIPNISCLNELRRNILEELESIIIKNSKRNMDITKTSSYSLISLNILNANTNKKISVLFNILNNSYDYSKLENIDKLYISLKYFMDKKFSDILSTLSTKFNTYIYMPTIIRDNYRNLFLNNIKNTLRTYKIKGFVISNIGAFELLQSYLKDYEFIGNYTLNVFNNNTINELKLLGISTVTLSPELNKTDLQTLVSNSHINTEIIVYGNIPIMNSNYCLIGQTNKCYPTCTKGCTDSGKYFIKDRLGFNFRILPDNLQTITTIFNSKITSISHTDISSTSVRIDILDESIDEITNIIKIVKSGNRFEGKEYTNGNLNRDI